jgi:hypothetical protein
MSQTNAFSKAQNPDYVYLDIQQTNVYNNTLKDEVDINFIETRDSPVIANTGDYTVSVTRFQIDTYKLPTMVIEPDLTTEPYDPERTIHKVALLNIEGTFPLASPVLTFPLVQALNNPIATQPLIPSYGRVNDSSFDGEFIVVGAPRTDYRVNQRGTVYLWSKQNNGYTLSNLLNPILDNVLNARIGSSVSISEDGQWIGIGAGSPAPYSYIIERTTLRVIKIQKPTSTVSNIVLNSDGTIFAIGYPQASEAISGANNRGVVSIYRRDGNTFSLKQQINGLTNNVFLGAVISINATGSRIIIGSSPISVTNGVVFVYKNDNPKSSDVWTSEAITIPVVGGLPLVPNYLWGLEVSISHIGDTIAVGSSSSTTIGEIITYKYDFTTNNYVYTELLPKPAGGPYTGYGSVINLSYDGTEVSVGCPYYGNGIVFIYVEEEGNYIVGGQIAGTIPNSLFGSSISSFDDARYIVIGAPGTETSTPYGTLELRKISAAFYGTIPDNIKEHVTVKNVRWVPNYSPRVVVPTRAELTGKNTVNFPYYWCNSYARFIGQVNKALGEAYAANFNYLYTNWISTLSTTQKQIFYNIVARFYSTPPFLEWSNNSLKASLVANALFNPQESNYAIVERLWSSVEGTAEHNPDPPIPFNFKIAFNASLYALFNSFPATETVINNEKFFIMDFTYPVPNIVNITLNAIPLYPTYPFLDPYIGGDGVINIPSPLEYGHIGTHIVLEQELSTIDTWCPINGIVFTTNTLPIVINQYSSNVTLNSDRPSSEAGADFALIITDLQSNQQGYKPNLIYTPTAEYRRVDMTGNLGLTNIDIRVFWRAKTGQLIPMKLGCGVTASIKLLFQKKLLGERQQLQFKQFSVKELKL